LIANGKGVLDSSVLPDADGLSFASSMDENYHDTNIFLVDSGSAATAGATT